MGSSVVANGSTELVHRALKDSQRKERGFKEDVCQPVVPLNCYPTTLRRRIVDVAGKIVRHAGRSS